MPIALLSLNVLQSRPTITITLFKHNTQFDSHECFSILKVKLVMNNIYNITGLDQLR